MLKIPNWLKAPFAWQTVATYGVYEYRENAITGARRAVRISHGGHSPVDRQWLSGGAWTRLGRPPSGGPTEMRPPPPPLRAAWGPNSPSAWHR